MPELRLPLAPPREHAVGRRVRGTDDTRPDLWRQLVIDGDLDRGWSIDLPAKDRRTERQDDVRLDRKMPQEDVLDADVGIDRSEVVTDAGKSASGLRRRHAHLGLTSEGGTPGLAAQRN
jgi:hypothetical protein